MNAPSLFPALAVLTTALALGLGCGSRGGGAFVGEVGTYEPDGGVFLGSADASASAALDAHIEQNHVTVTFVTLICTGPCADVVAVPTGGHAPYTFEWDDGSTSASRHVCPASSTSYSVKVTDTGTSGELARPAETVQVPLTASVLSCPDGGSGEDEGGGSDAGCFEATADASALLVAPAPTAQICPPSPVLESGPNETAASCDELVTGSLGPYAEFAAYDGAPTDQESLGVALCQPLQPGETYAVRVDLNGGASSTAGIDPIELDLWGGGSECPNQELFQTSAVFNGSAWSFCFTFTPRYVESRIRLAPRWTMVTPGAYEVGCAAVSRLEVLPGATSCPDDGL